MMGYRTMSDDSDFLNGFQWEQLISTYLPNLYELKFRIAPWKTRLNNQLIDSFKTDFWIQHKWFVDFDDGILYTTPYIVLHIEVNDTYPFPVLRLLLHEMKSLRFISIKSDTFKYEVEEILALLKEVLNGIEYQVNIKRDILSIWF
ncbi:unnamed protein product [Rotaria sp. Silwood1]|nr:unnamed protein product [Rotaria sp. Silwood1]CAF3744347.1 unnamed protein product [Rotaria sp. Silwood1]CAF4919313.1 unnamed protein product [Rotaria sp. Silwood1]